MNNDYIPCSHRLPEEGLVVDTQISDEDGWGRNFQELKRVGNLWFFPDESMYVYYTPTHWKPTK